MKGMEDKELEKCKKIDEVIDIINSRKEEYLSYKENIDIHFKDNTNFPSENVAVIGRKNTLQEIRESSSQIEEQFDKGLNLLNKYNKKIPINKAIKYMKEASAKANQRDVEGMKKAISEFEDYCKDFK